MSKHLQTPICIVGAGPGGASAAILLAQHGIKTILVDKATFPRHKADGDVLTSNVISSLYRLDPQLVKRLETIPVRPLKRYRLHTLNKRTLSVKIHSPHNEKLGIPFCYSCQRIYFDQMMIEEVKRYKAIELIENCNITKVLRQDNQVILTTKDKNLTITTNLVIVATGANTPLTRSLGGIEFNPDEFTAGLRGYFRGVEGLENGGIEYFISKTLMPGGICVMPLANGYTSVSMLMRCKEIQTQKMNFKAAFWNELQTNPNLKNYFKNATLDGEIHGAAIQLGVKDRILAGDNYLLVGDAAGLTDPISANGIGHALISGMMAAEHALICLQNNDFSANTTASYSQKIHHRLKLSLRTGRMAYALFNYPRLLFLLTNFLTLLPNADVLNDILYTSKSWKNFFRPSFYRQLFFK